MRGYRSYGDLTLNELTNKCEEIMGEWNGDDSGKQEDRANAASELLTTLTKVLELYKELEDDFKYVYDATRNYDNYKELNNMINDWTAIKK
jgi:hypothetical protein